MGSWELNWQTGSYKCGLAQSIAITLLGSLQAVNLFWLWLILRIAKRYVLTRGEEAVDERSEDEEDSSEEGSSGSGSGSGSGEDKKDL